MYNHRDRYAGTYEKDTTCITTGFLTKVHKPTGILIRNSIS